MPALHLSSTGPLGQLDLLDMKAPKQIGRDAKTGWLGYRGIQTCEHALMCWCRTYTVHWVTEKAGDYLITGWLEGCTVGGCAKACAVQPGPLDASQCSCAGEELVRAVAGIPATFTVTACDRCISLPSERKLHSPLFEFRTFNYYVLPSFQAASRDVGPL